MSSDTTEESSTKTSGASSLAPSTALSLETSVTLAVSIDDNDASPPHLPGSSEESQHPVDPKVPGKSDGIRDEPEANVAEPTRSEIEARFATLRRKLRYGDYISESRLFDDDDKATFLLKSMRSVQWIHEALTALNTKKEPEEPEPTVRLIATPEAKHLTWKEWEASSGSNSVPHSALYILSEEPNSMAKQLPSRIRICSLAAKRIIDTMFDDNIPWSSNCPIVLLRPYKLLTYYDQKIRDRLSELEKSCSDHLQQTADEKEAEIETGGRFEIEGTQIFATGTNWSTLTLKEKQEAAKDLRVVVSFMDEYLAPLAPSGLLFRAERLVRFSELWHFLIPGSLVYVRDRTVPQKIWKVLQGSGGRRPLSTNSDSADALALGARWLREKRNPFSLDCYYIDYDGTDFVRVIRTFTIEEFPDAQQAKLLQILPISIAEQEGLVKERDLMERGKAFIKCATMPYKYMYYRGRSLSHAPNGDVLTRPFPGSLGSIAVLSDFIESPVVVDFERCLQLVPDWSPTRSTEELLKGPENELNGDGADDNIEDDRVWDVRMLKEILPKKEAWEDLQINLSHKKVIESLMRSHFEKSKSQRRQFDLIQDKGKGLIILLHGVPGVGKTSTAETVAEYYNKPLLPITCGDLGLTPQDVEKNLQKSFALAQAWQCVLLLDEADVFLAERSRDSIERNALVSVFLRVLEYYEGVLFLTTNKDRRPEFKPVWNGRQIRNAFQTAVALAEVQQKVGMGIKVTESHFEQVSLVSNEFNTYLWRTKLQRGDDVLNLKKGYRDDTFRDTVPSYANDGYANNLAMATMQNFTPQATGAPGPSYPVSSMPIWGSHRQDGSGQPAQANNASFMPGFSPFGTQQPPQQQSSFQASGYQQQPAQTSVYAQSGQQQQQQLPASYGNAGGQSFAGGGPAGSGALQQGQNQGLPSQQSLYNHHGYSG
ncbi:aaa family ATPase [Grosmannia clavigera kw1407]|uniref:Aaa family ATPase n=1 Tax=Grosmannia clavigera (strain kw1407 / UAMH 11150) TaxID=655863 RepID=F0XEX9_GROCL|nr:aaa family ATPase [Grosmannia clavigera kw1407]EFX04090.1 aaa family ATPase [Grosmannia clavigera kw1407]